MANITYYNKNGKRILKRDFVDIQLNHLVGGNALRVSVVKKEKTLITKKDLEKMQDDGLIEVKKFKGKNYLNEKELLYALKVIDRKAKKGRLDQRALF